MLQIIVFLILLSSVIIEQKVEGSDFFTLKKLVLGPGSQTLESMLLIYMFATNITDWAGAGDICPWHLGAERHGQMSSQKGPCNPMSVPMSTHERLTDQASIITSCPEKLVLTRMAVSLGYCCLTSHRKASNVNIP